MPPSDPTEQIERIVEAFGENTTVSRRELAHETDFEDIVAFYRSTIQAAQERGETVAVDVTPGRKFMSAIAFQAGFQFGADHIFYFHRKAGGYHGQYYPEIPRTATNLIDFTDVI